MQDWKSYSFTSKDEDNKSIIELLLINFQKLKFNTYMKDRERTQRFNFKFKASFTSFKAQKYLGEITK